MTIVDSLRAFCTGILATCVLAAASASAAPLSFNRDVRPILADACFPCHGPDPGSRQADLRFDREEGFFGKETDKQNDESPVVRKKPEASPLYQRITSKDPDLVMPPPDAHRQLKPAEKEIIRRWIAEGAEWQAHWSFITPERPPLPKVKNEAWVKNPIDRFVLAELEQAKLTPAPEADSAALCRRLYLDLTGLPPTPAEVAEFVSQYTSSPHPVIASSTKGKKDEEMKGSGDEGKEKAYLALVDKLLASPRYGEHRARYWLDAARYADTHGLHFDNYREIWPYRDWVIRAINKNQPFDQFTIDQIAGDLLPNPTDDQRIATGFHRCNITTNEGGTIADENLAGYARDRVETTAWVWLGLTANCCVCHDHKFDPLASRDFYRMTAFFRNTTQGSHDGNIRDTKPVLFIPQPEDRPRFAKLSGEIKAAQAEFEKRKPAAEKAAEVWQKTATAGDIDLHDEALVAYAPLREGEGDTTLVKLADGRETVVTASGKFEWRTDGKLGPAPVFNEGVELDLGDLGNFARGDAFSVALWLRAADKLNDGVLVARTRADGKGEAWKLMLQQGGKLTLLILAADGKTSVRVTTRNPVARAGNWVHVAATYDGSGSDRGIQLYASAVPLDGSPKGTPLGGESQVAGKLLVGGVAAKTGQRLVGGAMQDLRVYARRLSVADVRTLFQLNDTRLAAATAPAKRTAAHKAKLTTFYVENLDRATVPVSVVLQSLEDERKVIENRSIVTHVQEEKMNSPAMANILLRGEYDKLGEQVTPGVFEALHPLRDDAPRNRLGLAQWLVDKENPLTARVTVNRYWQEIFGTGLVKTAEDFGIMGELPSHPELLDWLAVEFREGARRQALGASDKAASASSSALAPSAQRLAPTRWNSKHLFRLIVTSAAYRQAATTTPEKLAKDHDNRLLSRGPRFRMDAEMIRDYALAASGTLSETIGGPSVKPYQPEGLWDIVGLPGGNTRDYQQDTGEALYRRSLYTFWKRMSPPPNMETFNAPSREFSCLRRERTNTPLQALVTLNDPQFVEASRNTAQAVLKQTKGDAAKTLDVAARRILCRPLKPQEEKVISAALAEMLSYYHSHKPDAESLIAVGESKPDTTLDPAQLAAWTNICNSLLNLDEALNK
jgi:hypothetical protein